MVGWARHNNDVGVPGATETDDLSLAHVLGRVRVIGDRLAALVRARAGEGADARFPGLVLSGAEALKLADGARGPISFVDDPAASRLRAVEAAATDGGRYIPGGDGRGPSSDTGTAGSIRAGTRLGRLTLTFGLDDTDIDLLMVAMAPEVDDRFEPLFGFLLDDLTRFRPTVGLALDLARLLRTDASARRRLGPNGRLVAGALVVVDAPERPLLSRSLRVADRVVAHLLGDDEPEPEIARLVADATPCLTGEPGDLARALQTGVCTAYVQEDHGGSGRSLAVEAFREIGATSLVVDMRRVSPTASPGPTAAMLLPRGSPSRPRLGGRPYRHLGGFR